MASSSSGDALAELMQRVENAGKQITHLLDGRSRGDGRRAITRGRRTLDRKPENSLKTRRRRRTMSEHPSRSFEKPKYASSPKSFNKSRGTRSTDQLPRLGIAKAASAQPFSSGSARDSRRTSPSQRRRRVAAGRKPQPSASVTLRGVKPHRPGQPNQDRAVLNESFCASARLYAVLDGHGPKGHDVSEFCSSSLAAALLSADVTNPSVHQRELVKRVQSAYLRTSKELNSQPIDLAYSGTTAAAVVHVTRPESGKHSLGKLIVSHVGDSRIVLGTVQQGRLLAVDLTKDHKPDDDAERRRIVAHGGVVSAAPHDRYGNVVGAARVWTKSGSAPGLAMSRSFGDAVAHRIGVTSEPHVQARDLEEGDKILILASDGVWEFITSQQALNHVCGNPSNLSSSTFCSLDAAERLRDLAKKRWVSLVSDGSVDDITVVVVQL